MPCFVSNALYALPQHSSDNLVNKFGETENRVYFYALVFD